MRKYGIFYSYFLNKKREAITYLSYSTPKKYLVDTDTILPRTTLSIS